MILLGMFGLVFSAFNMSCNDGKGDGGNAKLVEHDEKAAERQARNEQWKPRFFTEPLGPKGRPDCELKARYKFSSVSCSN